MNHRFPVLQVAEARQALQSLALLQPRITVVQVSRLADEALRFIRLVAGSRRPIPVIAVAMSHDRELERAIWDARATWYMANAELHLDRVLSAALSETGAARSADQEPS
jgi:DNA-binding NarL/FixJ family response regulator